MTSPLFPNNKRTIREFLRLSFSPNLKGKISGLQKTRFEQPLIDSKTKLEEIHAEIISLEDEVHAIERELDIYIPKEIDKKMGKVAKRWRFSHSAFSKTILRKKLKLKFLKAEEAIQASKTLGNVQVEESKAIQAKASYSLQSAHHAHLHRKKIHPLRKSEQRECPQQSSLKVSLASALRLQPKRKRD